MGSKVNLKFRDYGGESSNMAFTMEAFDATNYADLLGVGGVLETTQAAIEGVTLGVLAKRQVQALDEEISAVNAANAFAQREAKWYVVYTNDTTGKAYSMEIPTADLSLLNPGTEEMNISAGAGQTLVNALNAALRAPDDDEPCTVQSVKYVSRDL